MTLSSGFKPALESRPPPLPASQYPQYLCLSWSVSVFLCFSWGPSLGSVLGSLCICLFLGPSVCFLACVSRWFYLCISVGVSACPLLSAFVSVEAHSFSVHFCPPMTPFLSLFGSGSLCPCSRLCLSSSLHVLVPAVPLRSSPFPSLIGSPHLCTLL